MRVAIYCFNNKWFDVDSNWKCACIFMFTSFLQQISYFLIIYELDNTIQRVYNLTINFLLETRHIVYLNEGTKIVIVTDVEKHLNFPMHTKPFLQQIKMLATLNNWIRKSVLPSYANLHAFVITVNMKNINNQNQMVITFPYQT